MKSRPHRTTVRYVQGDYFPYMLSTMVHPASFILATSAVPCLFPPLILPIELCATLFTCKRAERNHRLAVCQPLSVHHCLSAQSKLAAIVCGGALARKDNENVAVKGSYLVVRILPATARGYERTTDRCTRGCRLPLARNSPAFGPVSRA